MSFAIVNRDNSENLIFDAAEEAWDESINVTEHPIEDGSTTNDHAQILPIMLAVTATISETPIANVPVPNAGPARVEEAKEKLRRMKGANLDVFTERSGVLSNMMLTRIGFPVNARRSATFTLLFRQVRISEAGFVELPPAVAVDSAAGVPVDSGAADEQDAGVQATTEDTRGESLAISGLKALGVL